MPEGGFWRRLATEDFYVRLRESTRAFACEVLRIDQELSFGHCESTGCFRSFRSVTAKSTRRFRSRSSRSGAFRSQRRFPHLPTHKTMLMFLK